MAWTTVIERNNETFNKSQGSFQKTFEIDEATYTAIGKPRTVKVIIGEDEEILPKCAVIPTQNMTMFGDSVELTPEFGEYNSLLGIQYVNSQYMCYLMLNKEDTEETSIACDVIVEIDTEEESNKKSNSLGVKDAMKHYISTFDDITPSNTIKGLTKQIMISTGEGEGEEQINAARTIAGIYEAAAVARGYDPDKQRTVKLYANLKDGNPVVDSSLSSFPTANDFYDYLLSNGPDNLEIYYSGALFEFVTWGHSASIKKWTFLNSGYDQFDVFGAVDGKPDGYVSYFSR